MVNYRPPLILVEKHNGEIHTYGSIEDLALQVEPIDVKNQIYEIYDTIGTLIKLRVVKRSKMILGFIPLRDKEVIAEVTNIRKEDDLRQRVIDFCAKHQIDIDTSSTEAMVKSLGAV